MSLTSSVELLTKKLIQDLDALEITEKADEDNPNSITINIKVSPEDRGRLIGKRGKTINAIRKLVKSVAVKTQKKINIQVIE